MKKVLSGFFVVCLLATSFVAFRPSSGVTAQDDSAAAQSSEIADLQTRVAKLETAVAGAESGTVEVDDEISASRPTLPDDQAATAAASDGEVLFEEPAATGFSRWTEGYFGGFGANQFSVQGDMLVAEPGYWTVLYAPYLPESPDYIVEVEMRQPLPTATPMPGTPEPIYSTIAGVAVRYLNASWEEQAGYTAYTWNTSRYLESPGDEVITQTNVSLTGLPPDPTDGEWHTYRVEIRGDTLRMYIDDVLMIEATGLQYQGFGEEGRVGILVSLGAVEIRAFRVIAWE